MRRFKRSDRVAEEILKEISNIIRMEMRDPRIGAMTSITRVEVAKDLANATVYVSVYGPDDEKEATMKALESGAGFIRSLIGRRMHIRMTPALIFRLDDSIEKGALIQKILKKVLPPEEKEEASEEAEEE